MKNIIILSIVIVGIGIGIFSFVSNQNNYPEVIDVNSQDTFTQEDFQLQENEQGNFSYEESNQNTTLDPNTNNNQSTTVDTNTQTEQVSDQLNIPPGMNLFNSNGSIFSILYPQQLLEPQISQLIGNTTSSRFNFSGSYISSEDGGMYTGLSISGYGDMFVVDPTQGGPEILINTQSKYIAAKSLYGGQVFYDDQGNEYFVGSGKTFPCDMGVICGNTQWVGVKKFNISVYGISYVFVFGSKEIFSLEEFKQTMESL